MKWTEGEGPTAGGLRWSLLPTSKSSERKTRRMNCYREQKRKVIQKEQRGLTFCENTQILEYLCWILRRELSSRNLSQPGTPSPVSSTSLSWAQATFACLCSQLLSFPAAAKAPWVVEAWLCYLVSPQQQNTISPDRRGTAALAPNGVQCPL